MTRYPSEIQRVIDDLVHRRRWQVTLCGSRHTCDPTPEGSDWDFLVYAPHTIGPDDMTYMTGLGFRWEGSEHYKDAAANFMSWRSDLNVNLILTTNLKFKQKHLLATAVCKELNLMNKSHRVMLFQAILYDNFPTSEGIPF
jgi:hypothetical protein